MTIVLPQMFAALKSIMPSKSDFDAIGFSIGSPWIPNEYYEAFAPDGKEGREYNAEEIYQMLIHQNHANRISQMQSRPNHTNGASQMQADQNNTNGVSQMQTDSNNANKSSQIQTDNGKSEKSSFDRHDIWQGICDKIQLQDSWNKKSNLHSDSVVIPPECHSMSEPSYRILPDAPV